MTTKTLELVRELASLQRPTWGAKLAALRASGVPTMDADLKRKKAELDDQIRSLNEEAGQKWQALEAAKAEVGAHQGETTEETVAKLDTTGRAFGEVSDRIAAAERVRATIVNALIASGDAPAGAKPSGSEHDERAENLARAARSAGQRITASDEYRALQADPTLQSADANLGRIRLGTAWDRDETASLLTGVSDTAGGAFVQPDRQGYYPLALQPLTILDLVTMGQTDSDLVEFVRQTSFTNNAGMVPEATTSADIDGTTVTAVAGGRKPESGMAFEVVQTGVKQIAHLQPATRRALADAGQLRTIIDAMLRYGLQAKLVDQIVQGSGSGENLRGILNTSGINAVPAGAQSHADKVHFGLTQIRLDNLEASGVAMHPTDWETVRLSRENTGGAGTGAYLFGGPAQAGGETLWGKPVAVTASVPQGTAIVGDWRAYIVWLREGTQVLATDSNRDWFERNIIAILAEMRAASGLPRPAAFASVNLAAA